MDIFAYSKEYSLKEVLFLSALLDENAEREIRIER